MQDTNNPTGIMEELAVLAMSAEADDDSSLVMCTEGLSALEKALDEETLAELSTNIKQIQESIEQVRGEASEDPEIELDKIRSEIDDLQVIIAQGPSAKKDGDQANGKLVLPEWVDESVFLDFISEHGMVVDDIEQEMLSLESGGEEVLTSLRRRIHTIKGEAGLLGLDRLEEVCHSLEDFLDSNSMASSAIDELLRVKDWIDEALKAYAKWELPQIKADEILAGLRNYVPPEEAANTEKAPTAEVIPETADTSPAEPEETASAPEPEKTPEPEAEVEATPEAEPEAGPEAEAESEAEAEPEALPEDEARVAASWDDDTIELLGDFIAESEEGMNQIDEILLGAEQEGISAEQVDAMFRVVHTIKGVAGFLELHQIAELAHTSETLLDLGRQDKIELKGPVLDLIFDSTSLLRRMLTTLAEAVSQGYHPPKEAELPGLVIKLEAAINGEITSESKQEEVPAAAGQCPDVDSELNGANDPPPSSPEADTPTKEAPGAPAGEAKATKIKEVVKVDLERVDNLVSLIGELVIVEAMIVNAPEVAKNTSPWLEKNLSQMSKITGDLQDMGMSMRMVPVRGVFQKMARMVRDLSRKSNKAIVAEMAGEGTEMDRSIVERINDPLVHMIRNSVDHGVETREERAKTGKAPRGTINLRAYHKGGSVVIEVSDDGRGLNRDAILTKARERGIVAPNEIPSDLEIYNLIFAPGFSTAAVVTEISGRGVGMDVVRSNIEAVGGRIQIDSVPGKGSTFTMMLPLTTAIIDGMLTSVGKETYIIPTLTIIQSFRPGEGDISTVTDRGEMIKFRDGLLPLFYLSRVFEVTDARKSVFESTIVVVEASGLRAALVVDELLGQRQTVIKSIADSLGRVPGVSGVSIMSDGKPGLILDVEGVVKLVAKGN